MLKRKALKKIMITTLTMCLLLAIYLMPSNNVASNKLHVEYANNIEKINIYLLNSDNLLVKASTIVNKDLEITDKIKSILNNLFDNSNELLPNGLSGVIPKKVKILEIKMVDGIAVINFSKSITTLDENKIEMLLESITYSITDLNNVNGVAVQIEGEPINTIYKQLPEIFTKSYGINKKYDINSTHNIKKVIVYYMEEIGDSKYYVPITKYVDDSREKIKIVIDDLSSNYIYEPNLVSYLNQNTELINFELNSDSMILNFNTSIFMEDGEILEEVIYSIGYSVFDNYNVQQVIFEVNGEEILKKTLKDIEFVR